MSNLPNLSRLIDSKAINFGLRSSDYAQHRPGFPPRFFDKIVSSINEYRSLGVEQRALGTNARNGDWDWKGKRVLDLGTGPGIVALECAARGALVVGIDIAPNQIEAAKKRAAELKLESVCKFEVATAEDTKQPSSSFDVVMAGQCWPWFKHSQAMHEVQRVLTPIGVFVIGQFCYLPGRSPVAKESEDLILRINPTWTMAGFDGLFPQQIDQLVVNGKFELLEQFTFDHPQFFTHAGWRGRMRTCNGVGSGTLPESEVAKYDESLAQLLKTKYPTEPLLVWHRIWAVIACKISSQKL